jgi:hypothetical protein
MLPRGMEEAVSRGAVEFSSHMFDIGERAVGFIEKDNTVRDDKKFRSVVLVQYEDRLILQPQRTFYGPFLHTIEAACLELRLWLVERVKKEPAFGDMGVPRRC